MWCYWLKEVKFEDSLHFVFLWTVFLYIYFLTGSNRIFAVIIGFQDVFFPCIGVRYYFRLEGEEVELA